MASPNTKNQHKNMASLHCQDNIELVDDCPNQLAHFITMRSNFGNGMNGAPGHDRMIINSIDQDDVGLSFDWRIGERCITVFGTPLPFDGHHH